MVCLLPHIELPTARCNVERASCVFVVNHVEQKVRVVLPCELHA